MIVTVQETIEHSRDITAEMVRAYLEKHRWRIDSETSQLIWYDAPDEMGYTATVSKHGRLDTIGLDIRSIAGYERREPHEILADIAEGR